jgi:hypothetical protein
MSSSLRPRVIAATVAGLAVAGGGAAFAATQLGSPEQENQAVLKDAAKQLGVKPSALSAALKKALENRVDAAVAAGRLTKAQGDELKQQIESGNVPLFGGPGAFLFPPEGVGPSFATPRFGPLFGRPGFGPPFAVTMRAFAGLVAASYLGLTDGQLRMRLENGKSLAEVAKAQGKSVDGLIQALVNAAKKRLDAAVAAGRLTRTQADSILSGLKAQVTAFVNGTAPLLGPLFGRPGFGPPFPITMRAFAGLDVASYLGLTDGQLRMRLENGKSLAEVAKAQGKSVDGLVQALVNAAKKRLDAAVAAGRLTRTQADSILSGLKAQVTAFVNDAAPLFGFRHGLRGGLPPATVFAGPGI